VGPAPFADIVAKLNALQQNCRLLAAERGQLRIAPVAITGSAQPARPLKSAKR
jgi:hypothetical protein